MSFGKVLTLNTGATIPQIGLGTWLSKPNEVENAVEIAIRNGYRHIDAAYIYENQDEVGRALKKVIPSVVKREELFITSKLWNHHHQPKIAEEELDETLAQLGLEYLDLYLIHWPVAFAPKNQLYPADPNKSGFAELDLETSLVDTWKAMIRLKETGKVKAIGVSNFTVEYIQGIIDATGVVPSVNQIEAHPLLPQDNLLNYCKEKGIHVTAYSPLGNNLAGKQRIVDYPQVKEIASTIGSDVTPAQVLVAWGVYRGYSVIPKSVQEERIISNFKQVALTEEQYKTVSKIGENNHLRFNIPHNYSPKWDIDLFGEEAEKTATHKVKIA